LSLEELKNLDFGKVDEAFKLHIRRVAMDCLDRPVDAKPRKVVLEVGIVPVTNDDGTADRVRVQMHVSSTVPKHRTRVYDLALRKNAQLVFSADSPENFDQTTIFDDEEN